MSRTKEQQTEYMRSYRKANAEKMRAYEKRRWHTIRGEQERLKHMEGKKCRTCEILLVSKNYGGRGTKFYCRRCVDLGIAGKHIRRMATRRWREKRALNIS